MRKRVWGGGGGEILLHEMVGTNRGQSSVRGRKCFAHMNSNYMERKMIFNNWQSFRRTTIYVTRLPALTDCGSGGGDVIPGFEVFSVIFWDIYTLRRNWHININIGATSTDQYMTTVSIRSSETFQKFRRYVSILQRGDIKQAACRLPTNIRRIHKELSRRHQLFRHTKFLDSAHTVHVCDFCGYQNKQGLYVFSYFHREADESCAFLGYFAASSGNSVPTLRSHIQGSRNQK